LNASSHNNPKHVVDVHTHIFEKHHSKKYVEKTLVIPSAEELKLIRGSDGKFSSLQKSAVENNISKFFILPVARDPKSIDRINDFYYRESTTDPRVVLCGTVSPGHPRLKKILANLRSRGAKLIKLHSFLQRFDILGDPALGLFEKIIEAGFPVIFDTSRIRQEHLMPEDSVSFLTEPFKLLKLHELLPDLKIIAAHGGGVLISDQERKPLIGSGIYLDISTTFNTFDWPENNYEKSIENIVYLLNHHDQDKLFFGTDSPWRNQKEEIEELKGLHLQDRITKDQMENIFWKNANRFFDLGLE
jgi:predicted TIM-barrel fold metal-dependent hydrolase